MPTVSCAPTPTLCAPLSPPSGARTQLHLCSGSFPVLTRFKKSRFFLWFFGTQGVLEIQRHLRGACFFFNRNGLEHRVLDPTRQVFYQGVTSKPHFTFTLRQGLITLPGLSSNLGSSCVSLLRRRLDAVQPPLPPALGPHCPSDTLLEPKHCKSNISPFIPLQHCPVWHTPIQGHSDLSAVPGLLSCRATHTARAHTVLAQSWSPALLRGWGGMRAPSATQCHLLHQPGRHQLWPGGAPGIKALLSSCPAHPGPLWSVQPQRPWHCRWQWEFGRPACGGQGGRGRRP